MCGCGATRPLSQDEMIGIKKKRFSDCLHNLSADPVKDYQDFLDVECRITRLLQEEGLDFQELKVALESKLEALQKQWRLS